MSRLGNERRFAWDDCREAFRRQLLDVASGKDPCEVPEPLGDRPAFVLAPNSALGSVFAQPVISRLRNPVAVVDDQSTELTIFGLPRWSGYEFASKAVGYPNAVALDFSVSRFATSMFEALCAAAGIERRDFISASGELGLAAVYEPVSEMRDKTLAELDRFLELSDRLSDDLSRLTLYAALLLRLTWDRRFLRDSLISSEDEYFSSSAETGTFRLGTREIFCDAGAHVGLVTARFLGATQWRYNAIHAFEPDGRNFKTLQKMCLLPLRNFHVHRRALADTAEILAFDETGTMGSHITPSGMHTCRTTRLDDEMERLTFLKMDIEGYEARALRGASRLIRECRPRIAVTAYHYAHDLLDIVGVLENLHDGYELRLRHHYNYYYDMVLYACEPGGWN